MKDGFWKTRDGRELKITDMDSEHLFNVVKLLKDHLVKVSNFKGGKTNGSLDDAMMEDLTTDVLKANALENINKKLNEITNEIDFRNKVKNIRRFKPEELDMKRLRSDLEGIVGYEDGLTASHLKQPDIDLVKEYIYVYGHESIIPYLIRT